jgi:hypothetical protein
MINQPKRRVPALLWSYLSETESRLPAGQTGKIRARRPGSRTRE